MYIARARTRQRSASSATKRSAQTRRSSVRSRRSTVSRAASVGRRRSPWPRLRYPKSCCWHGPSNVAAHAGGVLVQPSVDQSKGGGAALLASRNA